MPCIIIIVCECYGNIDALVFYTRHSVWYSYRVYADLNTKRWINPFVFSCHICSIGYIINTVEYNFRGWATESWTIVFFSSKNLPRKICIICFYYNTGYIFWFFTKRFSFPVPILLKSNRCISACCKYITELVINQTFHNKITMCIVYLSLSFTIILNLS